MATIKQPETADKLIQKYYSDVKTKTLDDYKDELSKVIENNLIRYNTALSTSTPSAVVYGSELEEIKAKAAQYVQLNQLSKYKQWLLTQTTTQNVVAIIADAIADGYTVVTDSKFSPFFDFKNKLKKFIMLKPESEIEADRKQIEEEITSLFERRIEIENEAMLSTETALQWAMQEADKQQKEYQQKLKAQAVAAAEKAKAKVVK